MLHWTVKLISNRKLHNHHGAPSATLEHPPNIEEFDAVSTHTIVSKSPLLQARINAMQKTKGVSEPVQIHNHIYHGQGAGPAAPVGPANPPSNALVPATHTPGPRLDIAAFTSFYQLPSSIYQVFIDNAVTGTHAFSHMTTGDLTQMGFKFGEVIDLKEAILLWAQEKS